MPAPRKIDIVAKKMNPYLFVRNLLKVRIKVEATITSKGQVTLPKGLREALNLSTGDKLCFVLSGENEVRMIPKHLPVQKLKGILPSPDLPVSLEEMKLAVKKGALGL